MKNQITIKNPAIRNLLCLALKEDIGKGDVTSIALPEKNTGTFEIIVKEPGIICGLPLISMVYSMINRNIIVRLKGHDGKTVKENQVVAEIKGPVRSILTGERTVLNLVSILSGIAIKTRLFVDAIKGTGAEIFDTRKTPPGMRYLAKYAVLIGGGRNHRQGLYDMVLIKDNHIAAMGLRDAVLQAKKRFPKLAIEVETENLTQFKEALETPADIIMLDNMTIPDMCKAVSLAAKKRKRPCIEASGGVTIENVRRIAQTGVDRIAIGGLTHSYKILDVSMEMAG